MLKKGLYKNFFYFFIFNITFIGIILSAPINDKSIDDKNIFDLQKNLQQKIETENNQQQLDVEKNNILNTTKPTAVEEKKNTENIENTENCFFIKTFNFSGNTIFSTKKLNEIIDNYVYACLSVSKIEEALNKITNAYIKKGFITSGAFLSQEQSNLDNGILNVILLEANINDFEGLRESEILTAFPFLKNKPLNLRDLEQGVEQINKLPYNKAIITIQASSVPNASSIVLKNNRQGKTIISNSYSNTGIVQTGQYISSVSLTQSNLLLLNDLINLSYTKPINDNYKFKDSNNINFDIAIPFGYSNIKYYTSFNNYIISPIISSNNQRTRIFYVGQSYRNILTYDYVSFRNQFYKMSMEGSINYTQRKTGVGISKPKLSKQEPKDDLYSSIAVSNIIYSKYGVFFIKPSIANGYNIGLYKDTEQEKNNEATRKEFYYLKLYAFYNTAFFNTYNYTLTIDTMYSHQYTNKWSIGGGATRGFNEYNLYGDKGITIKNDINFNIGQLIKITNINWVGKILYALNTNVFLDYSNSFSNQRYEINEDSNLIGVGVKQSFQIKYFDAYVSYEKPIYSGKKSNLDNYKKDQKGNLTFYVNFSVSLF